MEHQRNTKAERSPRIIWGSSDWHTSLGVGQTSEAVALPALWTWCQQPRYHTAGCSHRSSPLLLPLEPSYTNSGQEFSDDSPKIRMKGWLGANTDNSNENGNDLWSGNRSERSLELPQINQIVVLLRQFVLLAPKHFSCCGNLNLYLSSEASI